MAKIKFPKPGTPSTKPGKPTTSPETRPGKPSTSPGEPGPRPVPRPPPKPGTIRPKLGIPWWDNLVNSLLDAYDPQEVEEIVQQSTEEELREIARKLETQKDAPSQRPGVITYAKAFAIAEELLAAMPPVLDEMDNRLAKGRLSQAAKRAEVEGIQRRLGGAGWQGPRSRRRAAKPMSDEERKAYRAEHRSRTGYPRGRPKKEDERREYPPKRPRGRPPLGN